MFPKHRHCVVGDMRLHYLDWGSTGNPPIGFLHGGALNAHTWDGVCAELRHDYHCYAIDLRGHGDSEWSPTLDYGLDAHVRDLEGFVEHIEADSLVLVGHSLGGSAAIRYASRHWDRLAALVVIDTSPFARRGPIVAKIRDFVLGADQFDSFDDAIEYVRAFNPSRDTASITRTLNHSLRQLADGRWTWKRDQRPFDDRYIDERVRELRALLPAVREIHCPTLVIRGEHGALTAGDLATFCSLLPDGHAVTVESAGHNVQSDNPAGLLDAIRPFLARHAPR